MRPYFARSGATLPPVGASTWLDRSLSVEYGTATSDAGMTIAAVLSVIQEKVNNSSADDPFEHEIATVSGQS
jgi:hypothetical protein